MTIFAVLLMIIFFIILVKKENIFQNLIIINVLIYLYLSTKNQIDIKLIFQNMDMLIYILYILYILLINSLKNLNDKLNYTYEKQEIQRILDKIFLDKKIKIIILFVISIIASLKPQIGIIFLIFIASFLRISRINMIVIPILFTSFNAIFLNVLSNNYLILTNLSNLTYSLMAFGIIILFYFLEKYRHDKNSKKYILFDCLYFLIIILIYVMVYLVLKSVTHEFLTILISFIITLILAIYISNHYPRFVNKDKKEIVEFAYNNKTLDRLFYFKLLSMFFVFLCLFLIYLKYSIIGIILIIIFNNIITKKIKFHSANDDKKDTKSKNNKLDLFILLIFIGLNYLVLTEYIQFYFQSYLNNIQNNLNQNFLNIMIPLQILTFVKVPLLNNAEFINQFMIEDYLILKFLELIKLMSIISIINITIYKYIFNIKRKDIFNICLIIFILNIVVQVLILIN